MQSYNAARAYKTSFCSTVVNSHVEAAQSGVVPFSGG